MAGAGEDPVAAAARRHRLALAGSGAADGDGPDGDGTAAGSDREAGQHVTPAPIARALVRWAVRAPDDAVLDPAVGGGVFAVAAAERLAALAGDGRSPAADPPADADPPPGRVLGVDVDGDALALAGDALAGHPSAGAREADFLALDPDDVGRFDAVVGNPPYVRQEGLDKAAARAHLAAFGPEGETPYLDGDRALDRRSDAYVYFVTAATRFLRPGGRLAMVVPTKWLATRYGESLQRFLLEHHRVHAVVGFDARAFDDALVDAALLCCERRPGPAVRRDGDVRFVRTAASDAEAIVDVIEGGGAGGGGDVGGGRAVGVGQATLAERGPGKLAHYLDAPPALVDLLDGDGLVPLAELAAVAYGRKTGANALFVLDPGAPVADRFRAPAVTSFRAVDGVTVGTGDVERDLLDVHDYVETVLDGDEADPAAAVLAAMERDGHGETAAYLRAGAAEYADRRTCAARRVWFDLGPLERPAVLHPKFFDARVRVVHNRAGAAPTNAIDCLAVRDAVAVEPLLGALNSSLYRAALECWGRAEGGGALQLMTYELERVPAPDVRAFDAAARERVAAAFRAYADGGDQSRLDAAVLEAAGVDADPGRVARLRAAMVDRRLDGDRSAADKY